MNQGNQQPFAFPPELLLAREIERHTGAHIDPGKLKEMIAGHWHRLSLLAHAIHNTAESERPKAQANPQANIISTPQQPWHGGAA